MKKIPILSAFMAMTAAACVPFKLAVVNFSAHSNKARIVRDVAFGPEPYQKLDIYMPADAGKDSSLPVVVFYYGGRWESGAKEFYKFVGVALARRHYIAVIPDYRKYPEVKFPVFVEDAAASLAWVSNHIGDYGGDASSIHVTGHSAGAHIGALLVTDARYLQQQGKDRSFVIRDFTGLAGPYNFTPDEPDLQDMFGPPVNYPQMQASTFVDGAQPPMFLLWGDKDKAVGRFNMDMLAAAIGEKGGCVRTKIYPGLDHGWIIADMSWLGGNKAGILDDWISFMNDNGCPRKDGP